MAMNPHNMSQHPVPFNFFLWFLKHRCRLHSIDWGDPRRLGGGFRVDPSNHDLIVKAVNVAGLLELRFMREEDLQGGLKNLDEKTIREAASDLARKIGFTIVSPSNDVKSIVFRRQGQ